MTSYKFNNLEITWLHHASFKIKSPEAVIYIDPYKVDGEAADLILITHEHYDHLDPQSIPNLEKEGTEIIASLSCERGFNTKGNVKILQDGETYEREGVMVKAVPAYNIGKPFHTKGAGKSGFIIQTQEVTVYHAGDTDHIPEMNSLEGIDLALLPIGGNFTMDEQQAADAVFVIKPKVVIPMHYGMIEGTTGDPNKFKQLVEANKSGAEVVILEPEQK